MDPRVGLASLAAAVLCAAAAQLGASRWMWAVAAGIAAGLLTYAVVVRLEIEDAEVDEPESKESASNLGPGSGGTYYDSQVINVNLESRGEPDPPP